MEQLETTKHRNKQKNTERIVITKFVCHTGGSFKNGWS